MEIGAVEFLTIEKIISVLRRAKELSIQENGLRVAVEVRDKEEKKLVI
ncbi:hypothetical protein [Oceanobacillus locisalsi]|uniref:Uncharacterized protein n=1 Tax=Oceanobacillus locisalsi TaxID=546107 RepID=A0ABW3NKS5_9BACI